MAAALAAACLIAASAAASDAAPPPAPAWTGRLERRLVELGLRDPPREGGGRRVALLVKDLATGRSVSIDAETACYLASGVKLPIALELLRRVDDGLSLEEGVVFHEADLLDGSPRSRQRRSGRKVTYRELLVDMLAWSDNTASDLVLREVGVERVNARVRELVPGGFGAITSLSDVRRRAYAAALPEALGLSNPEIRALADVEEHLRLQRLAEVLGSPPADSCVRDLDAAFEEYYACGLNSATLKAYGELLEAVADGRALRPATTALLLDVMARARTGKRRIGAGLPPGVVWAHKTGTQHERVGDFGLAWPARAPGRRVIIAAVASGFPSLEDGERALRQVGEAVRDSGVLDPEAGGAR